MVDRVARAITPCWEAAHEFDRENYRHIARCAIEAMREPTQAMNKAAYDASACEFPDDAEKCWQTMIDEALK